MIAFDIGLANLKKVVKTPASIKQLLKIISKKIKEKIISEIPKIILYNIKISREERLTQLTNR